MGRDAPTPEIQPKALNTLAQSVSALWHLLTYQHQM